jgi:PAX-interacting protein 1
MQPGFNQQQQFQMPQFQRAASGSDKKQPRRRRQVNIPPNINFQPQQFPQQQLPNQQQQILNQQILPPQQQPILPNQQQPILPNQQQPILPNQQQPILPNQQQPILPNQQQPFNPNYNQMNPFPSLAIFQNGETYPTMDPQFTVQAQISAGPNGNSKK